jgi:hypothetical protein
MKKHCYVSDNYEEEAKTLKPESELPRIFDTWELRYNPEKPLSLAKIRYVLSYCDHRALRRKSLGDTMDLL